MSVIPVGEFNAAFALLKKPDVTAALDQASGFSQAVQIVSALPASRILVVLLRAHVGLRAALFVAIQGLVKTVPDPRFESPNDAPLFCLLVVAAAVDHGMAAQCAELIRTADNLWWARHGVTAVLENRAEIMGDRPRVASQDFQWPSEKPGALRVIEGARTPNVEYRLPLAGPSAAETLVGTWAAHGLVITTQRVTGTWPSIPPNLTIFWAASRNTKSATPVKLGDIAA